jgi:probable phosphomutase (TIGR03848 family)
MAYILLIRHGQNDWVNKRRLAGWTPGVHLNEEGRSQAQQLSDRLSSLPLKAIYSSPLERCMETAAFLARPHGLEVVELDAVGEVHYGKWQGKKIKKLAKKRKWYAVQHFPSRFRFPGGESLAEVQKRAVAAIERLSLLHEKELAAVVSHADVIKLILANYLGMHIDLFQRIVVSPASVSFLALSDSGPVGVLRVNDDGPIRLPEKDNDKEEQDTEKEGGEDQDERADHN